MIRRPLQFKKRSKYGAIKTVVDGRKFDSLTEAEYYAHLKQEQARGKIKILEFQPKVYLTAAKILFKPDFLILDCKTNERIYIDYKGKELPVFMLKKRLWRHYGIGKLWIVKKQRKIFVIDEVIEALVSVSPDAPENEGEGQHSLRLEDIPLP